MSFDDFELPCIFVPEGGKLPEIPWGDPAIFPAIFIPDGDQGLRPGYPWIEFGRMTLQVPKARSPREPASAATTAGTRQSMTSVSDVEPRAVAPGQLAVGSFAPTGRNSDEARRATNVYPDLGATVRRWTSLSDLRAMTSALDALSPSSPFVGSAAPGVDGGSSGEEIARGPLAPRDGNSDGARLATSAYPDLGATVRSLDSLSDLRAMTSALDALSPSSPYVASAARGIGGGSSGKEITRSVAAVQPSQISAHDLTSSSDYGSTQGGIQLASVQKEEEEREEQIGPLSPLTGAASPRASDPAESPTVTNPPVPILGGAGGMRPSQTGGAAAAARAAGGEILRAGETPASHSVSRQPTDRPSRDR